MELKIWQNGLKSCVENIFRLRDDGVLLMEHESYAHAFHSFHVALEELWKVYFLMRNVNSPAPREFAEFIGEHMKNGPHVIYRAFRSDLSNFDLKDTHDKEISRIHEDLISDWELNDELKKEISKLQEKFKKPKFFSLDFKEIIESIEYRFGSEIIKEKNKWDKLVRINVSLNPEMTDWEKPQDVQYDDLKLILLRLNEVLERVNKIYNTLI